METHGSNKDCPKVQSGEWTRCLGHEDSPRPRHGWYVSHSPDYLSGGATVIRDKDDYVIAVLTERPEKHENAQVIAGAPTLVALVRNIHDYFQVRELGETAKVLEAECFKTLQQAGVL